MFRTRMTIAACLAGTGLLLATGCGAARWNLGMQTYTFREYTMLESIDKVAELGLLKIEAYSGQKVGAEFGDMKFDYKSSEEARMAVKEKLDEAGVELVAYYFGHLGGDEAVAREVFEFAGDMDIEIIVCEPPLDKVALVDELANEYRIDVAIHQHARNPQNEQYVYWCPDEVMKVLEGRSRRMGACADTGHWTRSGVNPVEGLRKYKGRLMGMHLKDMNKAELDGHDVVWGSGVSDMAAVLAEMQCQGFEGLASIEYEENPQDNMAEVAKCIAFHNTVVQELEK